MPRDKDKAFALAAALTGLGVLAMAFLVALAPQMFAEVLAYNRKAILQALAVFALIPALVCCVAYAWHRLRSRARD